MVDQISPADREYSSSVVFQQFSRLPVTGKIPDPIIGQFNPEDTGSVDDFKEKVRNVKQSAQVQENLGNAISWILLFINLIFNLFKGTNTYETLNTVFGPTGLFNDLPTVTGVQPNGEEIEGIIQKYEIFWRFNP